MAVDYGSAQTALKHALALHQQGRLLEAEAIYRRILQVEPRHFDSLHLAGVVALQTQRPEAAARLLDAALKVRTGHVRTQHHLAQALHQLKRFAAAQALLDQVIGREPEFADAYLLRGVALHAQRCLPQALADFEAALERRPRWPAALVNRGTVLRDLGRAEQALASFEEAIALQADLAEAHCGVAASLFDLQRYSESLSSCDRAIALRPGHPAAHANRAAALRRLSRLEEALQSCDRALELDSQFADAHVNRAAVSLDLKRPLDAVLSFDQALRLQPGKVSHVLGRAAALRQLQRPEAALADCDLAISLEPGSGEAHGERGLALADLNRPEDALASYERAMQLEPDSSRPHFFNAALAYLSVGRFHEGWTLYERRNPSGGPIAARSFVQPALQQIEAASAKSIFVYCEQGLGDTIQFSRYVRLLAERAARVTLRVQEPLRVLMQQLGERIRIVGPGEVPEHFDFHCSLLSLPGLFATTMSSVPLMPRLYADPARIDHWRGQLGNEGTMIGICWQGSQNAVDLGRSFPLHMFGSIAKIPQVRLISLQKGYGAEQIACNPAGTVRDLGPQFDEGTAAFLDSAAVISLVDLVITSDTSIAHLAGALGQRTWVALKHAPDWRWFQDRTDSPWYPAHRLYRQSERGNWQTVFDAMYRDLLPLAHGVADSV